MAFGLPASSGDEGPSYGSYLQLRDLLGLQTLTSDPPEHDELLFIVVHQVYELWFKQLLHELDGVVEWMDRDDPLAAQRLLRRCIEIQRVLTAQIKILETMTPNDFLRFRDRLRPASGFQSSQFRSIEALSGLRDGARIADQDEGSAEQTELRRRYREPSVSERFYALLGRRGFRLPGLDPARETSRAPEDRATAMRELVRLYEEPRASYDLYLLAEALIEFDEMFMLWRLHHVEMVERMIGSKPGTGGSEGVGYLRRTLSRKLFPALWELRGWLGAPEEEQHRP